MIRHSDIKQLGFTGGSPLGYVKGKVRLDIYEDDDRLDSFMAYVDNIRVGWIKSVDQLKNLLLSST